MFNIVGAVFTLCRGVAGGHEQLLESGRPWYTESPVPVGCASTLSHYMLPAQATSTGTSWPRRRRLMPHLLRLRASRALYCVLFYSQRVLRTSHLSLLKDRPRILAPLARCSLNLHFELRYMESLTIIAYEYRDIDC